MFELRASRKTLVRRGRRTLAARRLPLEADSRGFTLLLAALVASVTLALGSAIFSIAQKQVTLSSLGRDSQFAFYAADTGAECALYWDVRHAYFGTTTPQGVSPTCDGKAVNATGRGAALPHTIRFSMNLFEDQGTGYCVEVAVTKNTSHPFTVVHADGYSTRCEAIQTSGRSLQRSVELRY